MRYDALAMRAAADQTFTFGRNWAAYAQHIGEAEIAGATDGLLKLLKLEQIKGRSFIDIGCGSGVHAVAAYRLGARPIVAVDLDPESVATTKSVARRFGADCDVRQASVFDLTGSYDIVYSWGALHHTGDLWKAIDAAASLVAPNGVIVIAIYRQTRCDALWTREKRWYSTASPQAQHLARCLYRTAFALARAATGRFRKSDRGMTSELIDVHDWLGGYPYETAQPGDVDSKLRVLGFVEEKVITRTGKAFGLFGSGCDEYVYRKSQNA